MAEVYGWVYRTGKEVQANAPAAACLGAKAPLSLYERTWLAAKDGRLLAACNAPFVNASLAAVKDEGR